MKKTSYFIALLLLAPLTGYAGKVKLISGDASVFKGPASFQVEFDYSETSIDGLDSEEEYIEHYRKKKGAKAKQWEKDWAKDKKDIEKFFIEGMNARCKKKQLTFTEKEEGKSDYKIIVKPVHMQTGTVIKTSSIELKMYVVDPNTNEELAVLHIPKTLGSKMGAMTPTVGMRLKAAIYGSAAMFGKYIKKLK